MDEKSMILEQERQQKAKKHKKRRKLKWIVGILIVVFMASSIWYMAKGRYLLIEKEAGGVEIVAGEGQEIVYARIESINGNEVTYTVTDMPMVNGGQSQESEESGRGGNRTEGQGNDQRPDMRGMGDGQMPNMSGMGDGQMPDMSGMGGGQMPDMSGMRGGQMPDMSGMGGGQMPDMSGMGDGQIPDMNGMDEDSDSKRNGEKRNNSSGKEQKRNTEPAEMITTYIPVGTEVTTKLGTITTFSRLAVGDYVAFIVEQDGDEQIIMAVYIVG